MNLVKSVPSIIINEVRYIDQESSAAPYITMQHPFQCITAVQTNDDDSCLIAACGPNLISLSLNSGEILSHWTADRDNPQLPTEVNGQAASEAIPVSSEPPTKKQKTSNDATEAETQQQNQPANKKSKQQKKNASPPKSSTIILLAISPDQSHLVAVTDDKYIRVFSPLPAVKQLGPPREMPKRPCAIQVSPNNESILVADKHGDVYSLPLIPEETNERPKPEVPEGKQFKPSATPLTVHSKRNLTALQAQQAQKQFTPRKDVLADFENTLLLGHVSMLTDMKFLSLPGEKRQWVATCDRDEHIRISRAPPQTHIIEGFCLGHQAFVSRICQVGRKLVSGGGDGWLGVWDFQTMKLERKVLLTGLVPEGKMAVSGIWKAGNGVVFTVERVEAIFYVPALDAEGGEKVFSLAGLCPLDVVVLGEKVMVSVDSREDSSKRLQVIDLETGAQDLAFTDTLTKLNSYAGKEITGTGKELDDLLYNVANLRKRGPLEDGEAAAEDETPVPTED